MHPLETVWQTLSREFEAAHLEAGESARLKAGEELNQTARRLKRYKTEAEWCDAVLDGAARFAAQAALFFLDGETLVSRGARGLALPAGFSIPLAAAAAFRNAREGSDLVIALCTAGEISEGLASAVSAQRAFVFPVANGERTAAFLFASADDAGDANALELIVNIASSALELHSQSPARVRISAGFKRDRKTPDSERPVENSEPVSTPEIQAWWDQVPGPDRLAHVRAHRLARTRVAEMQLYRPEACKSGRSQKDIYLFLKREIDGARDTFRNQFMATRSMVDYLHIELTRQLAGNDDVLLGADYPGQMV